MGILKDLKDGKSRDNLFDFGREALEDLKTKCRVSGVAVIGWIRPGRWDKEVDFREVNYINFYEGRLYYRRTNENIDDFFPVSGDTSLSGASIFRNLPTLIRATKIKKYFNKLKDAENLSLDDARKLFGRLFYCLRVLGKDGTQMIVFDFVSNKKDVLTSWYSNTGWYYNPKFDKEKVLTWWEKSWNEKYVRECGYCGKREVIAYKDGTLNLTRIGDAWYCEDCLKRNNYGVCDISGQRGFRVKMKFANKKDKSAVLKKLGLSKRKEINFLPESINGKGVRKCNKCGSYFVPKAEEERWCSECKLTIVSDYGDKRYKFLSAKSEHSEKLFFGTECEIEVQGNLDKCSKILNKNLSDLVYLKSDGSISHGFEIVSYAMTYKKWYNSLKRFKKNFQAVINKGGFSESAHTTGLHIHLSRDGFKDRKHLARFARCFYLDKDLSREVACREFNTYAQWNDFRQTQEDYFEQQLRELYSTFDDRYHIVNFRNNKTVEIRMFNGTLRADVIFAYIQFCKLLVDYSRVNTVVDKKSMITYIKKNAKSKVLRNIVKMYEFKKRFSLKEVKQCA